MSRTQALTVLHAHVYTFPPTYPHLEDHIVSFKLASQLPLHLSWMDRYAIASTCSKCQHFMLLLANNTPPDY